MLWKGTVFLIWNHDKQSYEDFEVEVIHVFDMKMTASLRGGNCCNYNCMICRWISIYCYTRIWAEEINFWLSELLPPIPDDDNPVKALLSHRQMVTTNQMVQHIVEMVRTLVPQIQAAQSTSRLSRLKKVDPLEPEPLAMWLGMVICQLVATVPNICLFVRKFILPEFRVSRWEILMTLSQK